MMSYSTFGPKSLKNILTAADQVTKNQVAQSCWSPYLSFSRLSVKWLGIGYLFLRFFVQKRLTEDRLKTMH